MGKVKKGKGGKGKWYNLKREKGEKGEGINKKI